MKSFLAFFFLILVFSSAAFPVTPASADVQTYDQLLHAIRGVRAASQARIEAAVEQEKVREAWETGKLIDEHILQHKERAEYGKQVMERLSKDLATSETELYRMLKFARLYPKVAPGPELSWSHYRSLVAIDDTKEREELARSAIDQKWDRDTLRREIRRRRHASVEESSASLPKITPGPLHTYQVIRLKDRLKIDLGFGIYRDLSEKEAKKFKEGDIVQWNVGADLVSAQGQAQGLPLRIKNASPADLFTYPAIATRAVDGDTFHALIDLGFGITLAQRVRLRRIDASEIETAEGKEAKASLEKILSRDHGRILLQSRDLDQHGRPIADVWVQGQPVDQELLDQGLAVKVGE